MATTGKLCALVVLACILGPIATGYLMPAGSTEHTGYEIGNPVNITTDLYNNTEAYDTAYTGIANNAYMIGSKWVQVLGDPNYYTMPEYVETGAAAGPIRTYSGTAYNHASLYTPGGTYVDYTIPANVFSNSPGLLVINWNVGTHTGATTNQDIYVDGEAITGPTDGGIRYEGGSQYVCIGTHQYSKGSTFRVTGYGTAVTADYFAATGYASDVAGQYVPAAADTWADGAQWINYKDSVAADYIFRGENYTLTLKPMVTQFENNLVSYPPLTITLSRAGAAVTATMSYTTFTPDENYVNGAVPVSNSESAVIGNYRDVLLRLQYDSAGDLVISVAGLGYSSAIAAGYESRIINMVELGTVPHILGSRIETIGQPAIEIPLGDTFAGMRVSAAATKSVIAYWASSTYHAGSYSVIVDNSVRLTDYFPGVTSSVQFRTVSQYGTAVDLPNNANLPVTDGKITVRDTDGEDHTISVKGLILLALWNGATYDCYVNDIAIGSSSAPAIGLDGAWLLTAYIYKTTAYTYTTQDWVAGSFNLDEAGFCVVGLICAFAAFVVAGLWGRKSGSKVLALMIIAAICGFVYFNLLLEV